MKKKIKVIYITTWSNRIYHNIFQHLSPNIDLTNIVSQYNKFNEKGSYKQIVLQTTEQNKLLKKINSNVGVFNIKYTNTLKEFVKKEQPDIIITNLIYTPITKQVSKIATTLNIPLIIQTEMKQTPRKPLQKLIYLFSKQSYAKRLQRAQHIIPWTNDSEKFIRKTFNVPKSKVTTLSPGINVKQFFPHKREPTNKTKILMIARFVEYKNHKHLLKAVNMLKDSALEVHFLGEGPLKKTIKKQVDILGLTNQVRFLKPIHNAAISKLMSSYDMLILPSDNEAIGMVVPEAMASGLPVIISETVGANTYITPNENGLVYPVGDIQALSRSIFQFLQTTKQKRFTEEAIKTIRKQYTLEKVGKKYSEVLEKIVKEYKQ